MLILERMQVTVPLNFALNFQVINFKLKISSNEFISPFLGKGVREPHKVPSDCLLLFCANFSIHFNAGMFAIEGNSDEIPWVLFSRSKDVAIVLLGEDCLANRSHGVFKNINLLGSSVPVHRFPGGDIKNFLYPLRRQRMYNSRQVMHRILSVAF